MIDDSALRRLMKAIVSDMAVPVLLNAENCDA